MVIEEYVKQYKCVDCGETDPAKFYSYPGRCKQCLKKWCVARRKLNPHYAKRQKEYYQKWYKERGRKRAENYGDVILLWQNTHYKEHEVALILQRAVNKGLLQRPKTCECCGRESRISGHHTDYDLPYHVMWLCASCHKKIHRGLDKPTQKG